MSGSGIRLQNINFAVGEFVMEDLSLEIRGGEYFVLTGPNGAGKTILIKLIAGLLQPSAGVILIDGRPVVSLPPWKLNIGYVPQDGVLFPNRTVRENVRFGLEVRGRDNGTMQGEVQRMASTVGIEHLLERKPAGLSGGERQKVSLARALVFKPALLLLGEPVSAVDEDARDGLCLLLKEVQRETGITTLHVSHNRRETELVADRVGVLAGGRLKE
ncbi:MAG: ATP-binding cassette domain-containing protein, partial [Planctomycetia bacterium]|nr:ATP-binding cassette domain-containing protein [Planctomycetia bacterium]